MYILQLDADDNTSWGMFFILCIVIPVEVSARFALYEFWYAVFFLLRSYHFHEGLAVKNKKF